MNPRAATFRRTRERIGIAQIEHAHFGPGRSERTRRALRTHQRARAAAVCVQKTAPDVAIRAGDDERVCFHARTISRTRLYLGRVNRIPDELLARFVSGVNLMPGSLRDQLGAAPTLLVFLRHFGCPFCKETIAGLRAASQASANYPAVLFFYQGSPTEGKAFLRRYWPEARAIADPDALFYDGFGIARGGIMQMFHPAVIPALVRAGAKGFLGGDDGGGDTRRMPGLFLARGGEVLWSHLARHQADHPEFARIPALAGIEARA